MILADRSGDVMETLILDQLRMAALTRFEFNDARFALGQVIYPVMLHQPDWSVRGRRILFRVEYNLVHFTAEVRREELLLELLTARFQVSKEPLVV